MGQGPRRLREQPYAEIPAPVPIPWKGTDKPWTVRAGWMLRPNRPVGGAVPDFVEIAAGAAAFVVAAAAFVVAAGVLWRTPFIGGALKWVWGQLVGEPLAERQHRNNERIVAEVADRIPHLVAEVVDARLSAIKARQEVTAQAVDRVEAQLTTNGGGSFRDQVTNFQAASLEDRSLLHEMFQAHIRGHQPPEETP